MTMAHVLLGAGGHARVVMGMAHALDLTLRGVCDPGLAREGAASWEGYPVLGDDDALEGLDPADTALLNGLGLIPGRMLRTRLQERWTAAGFGFPACVHPHAWVSPDARLEAGVQIMAGAVVQPGCIIGAGVIVNTGATVDHDCTIGRYVHVAPGATLCGGIAIGDDAFVGAGATVINGRTVGERSMVAAGAVLVSDIGPDVRFYGPSKSVRNRSR